jgi:hypothetical protein
MSIIPFVVEERKRKLLSKLRFGVTAVNARQELKRLPRLKGLRKLCGIWKPRCWN